MRLFLLKNDEFFEAPINFMRRHFIDVRLQAKNTVCSVLYINK